MSGRGLKRVITYEPTSSKKRRYSRNIRKNVRGSFSFSNGRLTSGNTGPEVKNYDYQLAATNVATGTPYIADVMAAIAQGDTETTRTGQKICVKGLAIMLYCYAVPGATVTINTGLNAIAPLDVLIVHDSQPDGGTPTVATIMGFTTTQNSYGLPANLDRFKILRREHFNFDLSGGLSKTLDMFIPLDVAVRYADATGAPNTNSFYVVALSSGAAAATATVSAYINGLVRVKYTDE